MKKPTPRITIRFALYVITIIAVAFAAYRLGYQEAASVRGGRDLRSAKLVSLSQLDAATNGQQFFYEGSDQACHYFRVENVGYYRLKRANTIVPADGFTGDGSGKLEMIWRIVTIEDGKLKAPSSNGLPGGVF